MKLILHSKPPTSKGPASAEEEDTHPSSAVMEGPDRPKMPAAGATRWTDREVAFVLNFTDFCLQTEVSDFRRDVEQELSRFANRKVTAAAISSKMRTVLVKQDNVKWAELADSGTTCLDLQSLPSGVFDEMQRQRKARNLKKLPQADDTHRAAPQGEGTKLKAETTIVSVLNIR
jgi:hypothetical protein